MLEDIPEWLNTCTVGEFVTWTPGVGKTRMRQMLRQIQLSPGLRLEHLSETTIRRLIWTIERYYSPARVRQARAA